MINFDDDLIFLASIKYLVEKINPELIFLYGSFLTKIKKSPLHKKKDIDVLIIYNENSRHSFFNYSFVLKKNPIFTTNIFDLFWLSKDQFLNLLKNKNILFKIFGELLIIYEKNEVNEWMPSKLLKNLPKRC